MKKNKVGKGSTSFNIILKDKHFKNDPILEIPLPYTEEEKRIADMLCEMINNDWEIQKWKGLFGWKGITATYQYLENDQENRL